MPGVRSPHLVHQSVSLDVDIGDIKFLLAVFDGYQMSFLNLVPPIREGATDWMPEQETSRCPRSFGDYRLRASQLAARQRTSGRENSMKQPARGRWVLAPTVATFLCWPLCALFADRGRRPMRPERENMRKISASARIDNAVPRCRQRGNWRDVDAAQEA